MSYYEDLGLPRSATDGEIRDRYRELAMLLHPDRGGDTIMFQCLNEAHELLSDPAARRAYDATLGPALPAVTPPPARPTAGGGAGTVENVPAWARDRWIVEEYDVVPDTRYHRWNRRWAAVHKARNKVETRTYVAAAIGAGVGALVGQFSSQPTAVALAFALMSALVGPLLYGLVRTGRRRAR